MVEPVQSGLIEATGVARRAALLTSPSGVRYAAFGETGISAPDLDRVVQAVPSTIAPALSAKAYYFVPLVLAEPSAGDARSHRRGHDETMIASAYAPELADHAICHRNVAMPPTIGLPEGAAPPAEGVFISTRLLSDRFSLAFEFFINVGHAFVDVTGVPAAFSELAWNQASAGVKGETSQDAWESRGLALGGPANAGEDAKPGIDEKAKSNFLESAFSDAVAIYLLSLSLDFDYSELREREYPLLAPQALAERLRLVNRLFPPNAGYEFAIRYRRRA